MQKTYRMKGYTLHVIPTKKFKTMTLSLKLKNELTKENATMRTLLTFMMSAGTRQLPSNQALSSYLDELYGAHFSSNIVTKGKAHVMQLFCTCIHQEYLPIKENLFEKQVLLLRDILLDPHLVNGIFDEEALNIKKKELHARMQSLKDDKYSYSFDRLLRNMGEGQYLGISSTGYEDEIDAITAKQLYDYYLKCLAEDEKDVYVVGDVDQAMIDMIGQYLSFEKSPCVEASAVQFTSSRKEVEEIIETQSIAQAKLNMGYVIQTTFNTPTHYAMTVLNGILGGFSHSRLFSVVREKHSLCYYISSSYDAFNGILAITSGIESKNYEKTKALIQEQIADLQQGNITDEEIMMTKILLKDAIVKSNDSALNMIALSYNRDISHKEESTEDYINHIMNVTKDELIAAAREIRLEMIYLLKGEA